MKKITLVRVSDNGKQCLGNLQIDGVYFCRTLERPYLDNKPNISAIPKGVYSCRWTFSPKLMRYTYQILNVPNRSGIRFHKGNFFFSVEGCILLGTGYADINADGQKDILNSKMTIENFERIMNKQDFVLEIR